MTPSAIPETIVTIAGRSFVADGAGVLWCPDARLLVVADLHLEKGSSFAARRMMLPPYDTGQTLTALARVVARLAPRTIVSLGDSFHDRAGPVRMAESDRDRLKALQAGRSWIWVAGNHDPALEGDMTGDFLDCFTDGALRFVHEPTAGRVSGEIAGHLHPAARISARGGSVRTKVFVSCETRLVMPAFGALTGGLDVTSPAIRSLFPGRMTMIALGRQRAYRVAA
jgi:DNA ligase-associated metallophosphoesterase